MKVDVVIIGAGPAGLTAAIELKKHGVSTAVIDEYYLSGGRLLGQHYEDPSAPPEDREWDGKKIAAELERQAKSQGVHIFTNVTVWSVDEKWKIYITHPEINIVHSKVLLLATGSAEKALPLPGWTLPGVISIGAAQTFTNLHRIAVGKKVLIAGVDPLSLSVMIEMKSEGIDVAGMVLPPISPALGEQYSPVMTVSRLKDVAGLAPNPLVRSAGKFALSHFPRLITHALKFDFLKVNGVPLHMRKSIVRIEGKNQVEAVVLQPVNAEGKPSGKTERLEVDAVCLSGGLYPLADLSETAGCKMAEIPELGGMVPLHGLDMSTTVKDLFVAGNITGIEGAKVAMAQGQLAAVTILKSLEKEGSLSEEEAISKVEQARKEAPLRFLPQVEKGRKLLNKLWEKEGIL